MNISVQVNSTAFYSLAFAVYFVDTTPGLDISGDIIELQERLLPYFFRSGSVLPYFSNIFIEVRKWLINYLQCGRFFNLFKDL